MRFTCAALLVIARFVQAGVIPEQWDWISTGVRRSVRIPGQETSIVTPVFRPDGKPRWAPSNGYETQIITKPWLRERTKNREIFEFFRQTMGKYGLHVSPEYTIQHTEAYRFDPTGRCRADEFAQPVFHPYFDEYKGRFEGHATVKGKRTIDYTIYIPVDGRRGPKGAMDVRCVPQGPIDSAPWETLQND